MNDDDDHDRLVRVEDRHVDILRRLEIIEERGSEQARAASTAILEITTRLKAIETQVRDADRAMFLAKAGVVFFGIIGASLGWFLNVADKVRAWLH